MVIYISNVTLMNLRVNGPSSEKPDCCSQSAIGFQPATTWLTRFWEGGNENNQIAGI